MLRYDMQTGVAPLCASASPRHLKRSPKGQLTSSQWLPQKVVSTMFMVPQLELDKSLCLNTLSLKAT